tara:strand:- start:1604 stop:1843 length:240 start_codon:yes stop_codon:yes gene_type:complete
MYLGPNFAFNKDPKESLGFLISDSDNFEDEIAGYIVKGSLGSEREVRIPNMGKLPLGKPDNKGYFWVLSSSGKLKKSRL